MEGLEEEEDEETSGLGSESEPYSDPDHVLAETRSSRAPLGRQKGRRLLALLGKSERRLRRRRRAVARQSDSVSRVRVVRSRRQNLGFFSGKGLPNCF